MCTQRYTQPSCSDEASEQSEPSDPPNAHRALGGDETTQRCPHGRRAQHAHHTHRMELSPEKHTHNVLKHRMEYPVPTGSREFSRGDQSGRETQRTQQTQQTQPGARHRRCSGGGGGGVGSSIRSTSHASSGGVSAEGPSLTLRNLRAHDDSRGSVDLSEVPHVISHPSRSVSITSRSISPSISPSPVPRVLVVEPVQKEVKETKKETKLNRTESGVSKLNRTESQLLDDVNASFFEDYLARGGDKGEKKKESKKKKVRSIASMKDEIRHLCKQLGQRSGYTECSFEAARHEGTFFNPDESLTFISPTITEFRRSAQREDSTQNNPSDESLIRSGFARILEQNSRYSH